MTDYESLIGDYSETFDSLIYTSLWITILTSILIFGWYYYRRVKTKKQRKEDDMKLQSYFERYSEIIADKVVQKIKESNTLESQNISNKIEEVVQQKSIIE